MGLLCSLLKRYNSNNCKNIEYLEQSLNTKTKICTLIIANVKIYIWIWINWKVVIPKKVACVGMGEYGKVWMGFPPKFY